MDEKLEKPIYLLFHYYKNHISYRFLFVKTRSFISLISRMSSGAVSKFHDDSFLAKVGFVSHVDTAASTLNNISVTWLQLPSKPAVLVQYALNIFPPGSFFWTAVEDILCKDVTLHFRKFTGLNSWFFMVEDLFYELWLEESVAFPFLILIVQPMK